MNLKKIILMAITSAALLFTSALSMAAEPNSVVGVGGYDLVSYHTGKKPLQGNGNHVVQHNGVNYLFSSKENVEKFKANKEKFLPAYGGYCAFGASVGKKFIADPTVWEIVDGRLYMNLDNSIKTLWIKDIPGNIKKADKNWIKIKDVAAADL
jgi:YHS domain-containing protein